MRFGRSFAPLLLAHQPFCAPKSRFVRLINHRASSTSNAAPAPPRSLGSRLKPPHPPSARTIMSSFAAGDIRNPADADGVLRRQKSTFRDTVSSAPGARHPPAKGRYVLYLNYGCPWAQRANIVRTLKGLEDVVELAVMGIHLTENGWVFDGEHGSAEKDPLYGFTEIRQLYWKANPEYKARYTVPLLWDKEEETIVNNESAEIIRILYSAFDEFLPEERREVNKPNGGLLPPSLLGEIDAMNEWVYNTVNNGVYMCGFAGTQEAYDASIKPLFASLDRLEAHLGDPAHQPYLFGAHITEADIRLYTTLVRFDVAYHTLFRCNIRTVRDGYPRLHAWLRRLYWDEGPATNGGAFKHTTYFEYIKLGYARLKTPVIVPAGPVPHILPLDA